MEFFIVILAAALMILGILGCILPVLPGPALNFAGLVVFQFSEKGNFETSFFVMWALITIGVSILDYFVPTIGAKIFGSSRAGIWGSFVGLLIGLIFFPPFGILFGPFLGAVVAELLFVKSFKKALRAGGGAFLGLLFSTMLKLMVSGMMTYRFISALWA